MEMAAPGVIIDGAHNEDGIAQFVSTAGYFAKRKRDHDSVHGSCRQALS